MKEHAKKHFSLILLGTMLFVVILELISHVSWGYFPVSSLALIASISTLCIRYILIALCFGVTVWSIIKRQPKWLFTLIWVILVFIGQIPKGHYETMGAILSIYNADPEKILIDTRMLTDEYESMTYFGYPQRYPLDTPLPKDALPSSIQSINISSVLILDDYALIEKNGLTGVYRGFVVFKEGSDLWEDEENYTRLDDCSDCWKIRIIDGLYWYHADPLEPPIFVSLLE